MTMIVNYPTKKQFRLAVESGADPQVSDPALMPEWRKYGAYFSISQLPEGASICVTNHPKRSGFAEVRVSGGKVKVL